MKTNYLLIDFENVQPKSLASRAGKQRKVKTPANIINTIFSESLEQPEIVQLIKTLASRKLIAISDENVTYHLDSGK